MGKSSRRHYQKMTSVALAIALPTLTMAAEESALPTIKVKAEGEPTYTVPKVQSSKYTEPLVDTPKTVTVLTAQNLKDQNLLSLRDALSTTPGITFGAGEGGGGYGDKINIRGFDSTYDTTVDGLRDSALTSRTDIFNNESIEVVKGSSSSTNGMGSVGGSVNLVSKAPRGRDFNEVNVGVGTDNYYRITGDFNKKLSETVAARLNVMGHQNDVPGRDVEKKNAGALRLRLALAWAQTPVLPLATSTRLITIRRNTVYRFIMAELFPALVAKSTTATAIWMTKIFRPIISRPKLKVILAIISN